VSGTAAVAVSSLLVAAIAPSVDGVARTTALAMGTIAVLLTIATTARWPRLLPWVLVSLVATYTVALVDRPAVDLRVPLIAAGLVVVGELASVLKAVGGRRWPRAIVGVLGSALVSVLVADVVLVAAALRPRGGLLLLATGGAAAVGLFMLISRLVRRPV
jgi:hypothetical protein